MSDVKKAAEKARFEWLKRVMVPNTSFKLSSEGVFFEGFLAGAAWQREQDAHHHGDLIDWIRNCIDDLDCRADEDCNHCDLVGRLHDYDLREKERTNQESEPK